MQNEQTNKMRVSNWGVGICHYTGKLVNRGFYLQCNDKYFSTQELLVKYLREIDTDTLTDEFLLEGWCDKDSSGEGYYYSKWELEDAKYIEIDELIFEVTVKNQ